jgi:CubicO group peptidase (beta-lactamase class C family)
VNHPVFDTDITFQMLLTHTSSLRDNWDVMPLYEGDSPLSLGYYLEEYFTPGGEFYSSEDNFYNDLEPGTSLNYCNNAIALVGYLVEVISGIPFDEYCEINIFDPLDMDETAWFLKDLNIDNIAVPYDYNEDWELEPLKHVGESRYPAGQLRTSSPQLCNFIISMLNDGTFESNSILNEDIIDLIFTPQFSEMPMMWTDDFIGLIWFGEDTWEFYWHHTGGLPGCSTEIRIYPLDEIGIVVLTNGPVRNSMDPVIDQLYIYGKEITNSPPSNPTCVYDKGNDEVILMSVDPDNDQIRYGISWDNNQNVDNWTDYFNSSLEVRINCEGRKGTIGVIAEDKYGGESVWVSVTVKNKSFNDFYHLIFRLIQRFPIFEKIINQIKL